MTNLNDIPLVVGSMQEHYTRADLPTVNPHCPLPCYAGATLVGMLY
jgi:hypothetical protein